MKFIIQYKNQYIKVKINGIIMFIMFIFCTIGMLKTAIYNTNSVTKNN